MTTSGKRDTNIALINYHYHEWVLKWALALFSYKGFSLLADISLQVLFEVAFLNMEKECFMFSVHYSAQ